VLSPLGIRVVQLVAVDPEAARCPDCGQKSTSGKEWVLTRPRDLPVGGMAVLLQWRKRRRRCRTVDCPRDSFTERVPEVPARARTTTRLRARLATAVEDGRCQAEVAATFGVSWPTVQCAVIAHARAEVGEPGPTPALGLDETRFGDPAGLPDRTAVGCAAICGRPGLSTSPVVRGCSGRSTGGPPPRCAAGSSSAAPSSSTARRWW
jgi:transposase